jgi:hypothetical protein
MTENILTAFESIISLFDGLYDTIKILMTSITYINYTPLNSCALQIDKGYQQSN